MQKLTGPHHKSLSGRKTAWPRLHRGLCALLLLPWLAWAEPGFWQASKGEHQLWILGSIHVGSPDFYPLPAPIMAAWQQADRLIVEADLGSVTPAERQRIQRLSQLPAGERLSQVLPTELHEQALSLARQYGLDPARVEGWRPWFLGLTLTQLALMQTGYQPELGVDNHFTALATKAGRPIQGLERVDEQFAYLATLGQHETQFLASALEQLDQVSQQLPQVIKAWRDGDGPALRRLLSEEMGPPALQAQLERRLLVERNHRWLQQLLQQPEGRAFLVVGALHLYGPDGLLQLLRRQGYRVEPVTPTRE